MSSSETKNIYVLYPFSASDLYPQEFHPDESVCEFMQRLSDKHNLDMNRLVLWYYGRQYRGYTMQQSKHVKMKDIRAQRDTCMHVIAGANDARFERSSSRSSGPPPSPREKSVAKNNTYRNNRKYTPGAQNTNQKSVDNRNENGEERNSKILTETQNTSNSYGGDNSPRNQPSRTENSEKASYPGGGISNRYKRQLTPNQLSHAGKYTHPEPPDDYYYPPHKGKTEESLPSSPRRGEKTPRGNKSRYDGFVYANKA